MRFTKTYTLLLLTTVLNAQNSNFESRLKNGELKMTFPSIYFKFNSIEYAPMPYPIDSCFNYIKVNIDDLNSFPVWRDSAENNELTEKRIKKIKLDLSKHIRSPKINFKSMGSAQKVSRFTINQSVDSTEIKFLLSLNAVFDVSGAILLMQNKQKSHIFRPSLFCWKCWRSEFHMDKRSRTIRKLARKRKRSGD